MKFELPKLAGVPLRTPLAANASPAGSVPEASDDEFPPAPPVAESVCEYATPTVPFGSELVVMASGGGLIVMESGQLPLPRQRP